MMRTLVLAASRRASRLALVSAIGLLAACGGPAPDDGDDPNEGPGPGYDLAPVATPDEGRVPLTVEFDHGAGGDLPGDAYTWDFGDGSEEVRAASPEHTFETPGTFEVEVTVQEGEHAPRRADVTVHVASRPPQAAFEFETDDAPYDRMPLEVSFDASTSEDDGEIVTYQWRFESTRTATGVEASHTFREPGTHTVELTVTDDEGQQDTHTEVVEVTAPDPDGFEITESGLNSPYAPGQTVEGALSIRMEDPDHTVRYAVAFLNVVEAQEPWPQAGHLIADSGSTDPEIFQKVHDHEALTSELSTTATFELKNDAPPGTYDLVVQVFLGTNTNPHQVDLDDRIALKSFRVEIVD